MIYSTYISWILGPVLQITLLIFLWTRRLRPIFPRFFTYIAFQLVKSAALFIVYRYVHDDYYYRSRKGVLLKELKERFGALVEVAKGARGEQRWRAGEHTPRHAALVRECLFWFTP